MSQERLSRIEERLTQIETKLKTLELDIEPEGRISEGFEYLSGDIDSFRNETRKRLDRLEHGQHRIQASLDVILRHLTAYGQDS
jgi:DNA repair exonuclease SbcCD ATPase subunit